jgi:hypothetical protein
MNNPYFLRKAEVKYKVKKARTKEFSSVLAEIAGLLHGV